MHRGSHRGGDDSSTIALLFGNGWPRASARQAGAPRERVGQLRGPTGSLDASVGLVDHLNQRRQGWQHLRHPDRPNRLKQDVPGANGWTWGRQGFRNETYRSGKRVGPWPVVVEATLQAA
jgi:hypothetical protein